MSNSKFERLVNNKLLFRLYLLKYLPMAFIAGIKVKELTSEKAITTVKYGWLTQNPFRSMYFACEAMAAELSTGLLVKNSIYQSSPPISMLIIENRAVFYKKATGKITFSCNDGEIISEMISKTKQTGEPGSAAIKSVGKDESGDTVAEFVFTWSVKMKSL